MVDYYQILGIPRTAGDTEIKTAYRSLVKIWHPDINAEGAVKFKQITEANAILADPKKRKEYDAGLYSATKQSAKKMQGYAGQKANFDIAVSEFLDRLSPKDRRTAKSLLRDAERLSAIKAQAHYGKVIAQINADTAETIAELKRNLQRKSKK